MHKNYIFTPLSNNKFSGLLTIFSKEISIAEAVYFTFPGKVRVHLLIDLALKVGLGEFRFVDFILESDGKSHSEYKTVSEDIEKIANKILLSHPEKLKKSIKNSIITKEEFKTLKKQYK